MARNAKWLLFLTVAVALFYWKILFTMQFSIVEDWEAVNQGYVWHQFAVRSIQKGILPLWDPYTFSGRSHIGEMQPGVFYPPKLFLYLWPLTAEGILSWRLFEQYFVLAHLLGAVFMFFLALELGIQSRFAALVSALCFALGGFTGNAGGAQLWDSAIWLPFVFLCLLRALRAERWDRAILYACFGGLSLGMPVLAGGLHVSMMDTIAVVTAAAYFAFQQDDEAACGSRRARSIRSIAVILILGIVTFASAAIQLLPSMEYAPLVYRAGGAGTIFQRVPFATLTEGQYLPPRSLLAFLFHQAAMGSGEFSPYLGTMTFFLVILGAWQYWHCPWVKYAAGLGVLSFAYSMGGYSFLYGVLYILAPFLNLALEAGRFIYLTNFAMALLAGFGVQALFDPESSSSPFLQKLVRALRWIVLIFLVAVGLPGIYGRPEVNEWWFASLLFLIGAWGIFFYILQGNRNRTAQFLMVALILWDLHVFNWLPHNRLQDERAGKDYFEQMVAARPVADFFHSQPGLFRVHIDGERPQFVNLGGMFEVQTTNGQAATALFDYLHLLVYSSKANCLFNVRYWMVPDREREGRLVFTHGRWKVYENPSYCPRAWVVHRAVAEPSTEKARKRMEEPDFDPLQLAYVSEPLERPLEEPAEPPAAVTFPHYQADRLELEADVSSTGLLVLSETYYPGWTATVNGKPAHIYKVDSVLRGVLVSPGQNRIVMEYRPASVRIGAILSAITFLGTFVFAGILLWRRRRGNTGRE